MDDGWKDSFGTIERRFRNSDDFFANPRRRKASGGMRERATFEECMDGTYYYVPEFKGGSWSGSEI